MWLCVCMCVVCAQYACMHMQSTGAYTILTQMVLHSKLKRSVTGTVPNYVSNIMYACIVTKLY